MTQPLIVTQLRTSMGREDRSLRITASHKIGLMMARYERRRSVTRIGERDRATMWKLLG